MASAWQRAIWAEWEAAARRIGFPRPELTAWWRFQARERGETRARSVTGLTELGEWALWSALDRSRRQTGWPPATLVDLEFKGGGDG